MDEKRLKQLIKLLQESDVSEITVEENGVRMTVRKGPLTIIEAEGAVTHMDSGQDANGKDGVQASDSSGRLEIVSPMVGTFFVAPAPGQDPFIHEGDVVEQGQTICIIEAMKIMNEIAADERARIVKVLPEDGSSVDFGQSLFVYEPVE